MTGRAAFLGKEFREILSTYKIYVIPAIFLLMGLLSPLIAKLTPDLVRSIAPEMKIVLPPPVAADAYTQLLKNLNQLAPLVVIFSLIGLVAEEKSRGTAAIILTKPLPRWSFIMSKFLASAVLVFLSTLLAYLACLCYTAIIFRETLFVPSAQAILLVMVYYLLLLALTLLASTVSRTIALAGAISVGGFLLLSLLPALHPWLARSSPGALPRYQGRILARAGAFTDALPALVGTLGLTIVLVAAAMVLFERQEL